MKWLSQRVCESSTLLGFAKWLYFNVILIWLLVVFENNTDFCILLLHSTNLLNLIILWICLLILLGFLCRQLFCLQMWTVLKFIYILLHGVAILLWPLVWCWTEVVSTGFAPGWIGFPWGFRCWDWQLLSRFDRCHLHLENFLLFLLTKSFC